MKVALVVAIPLAVAAATAHAVSSTETPLPAKLYYHFARVTRSVFGSYPVDRFIRDQDPTSRRENFLVCFWAYFLVFVVLGNVIWFTFK